MEAPQQDATGEPMEPAEGDTIEGDGSGHALAPMPGHVDAARTIGYEDAAGEFRWKALDTNGNEVADSGEGYVNKAYAEKAAKDLFPAAEFEWESEV